PDTSERQEWMGMMLSDKELIDLINDSSISGVRLPPDQFSRESPVQAASVDLHIGGIYLPGAAADEAGGENQPLREHLLNTGDTVLVRTAETLKLPSFIGGFAFPPSSFAVKALLVTNAGHVDPEYSGPLRFTIINMGHQPQKLEAADRVGTLVLLGTHKEPERGWTTRNGGPGRDPNTEDLRYLSRDFAEVTGRTKQIARDQVGAAIDQWDKRLAIGAFILTLVITAVVAAVGLYSPVGKLDSKIDALREEFTHAKKVDQIDERLKTLEMLTAQQSNAILKKRVDDLGGKVSSLESQRRGDH
ncbi:MAG: dCTP deaminase domain-containing protein, partial [Candidatus Sulfotelmatobacter sp.]